MARPLHLEVNNNKNNLHQRLNYINDQPVLRIGDRMYALPALTPSQLQFRLVSIHAIRVGKGLSFHLP